MNTATYVQAQDTGILEEVVVTATRQSDTINRVPLSVAAATQKTLDEKGVKDVQDLARTVPSVTFRRGGGEGNPSIAIRGISSVLGAPTTGIYLDDTPLQKRDNNGSATGNGTPFPQIFDLERVEVLRGPQGTLYGGSAQGGAVRFITPSPSLNNYSAYARTEISSTKDGGASYEGGVAVGGPIVQDKLGFRASVFARHKSGYVDEVSIYDGHTIAKDVNSGNLKVARIAVTWAVNDRLRVTPALYISEETAKANDNWWEDVPQFTLNSGTFTNAGTVNGVRYNFPDRYFPGGVFGPYNQYGPYKTATARYLDTGSNAEPVYSPRRTQLQIPTLTLDYEFEHMTVKSITSFLGDRNGGYTGGLFGARTAFLPTSTNSQFVGANGLPVPGGLGSSPIVIPGAPTEWRQFNFYNARHGVTEEIRFTSVAEPDQKLSWVAGVFFSNSNLHQFTWSPDNENASLKIYRGIDSAWLLGQTSFDGAIFPDGNNSSQREVHIDESEIAAFGELNYNLTSKLKATAGVRVSRLDVTFWQQQGGPVQGAPEGFVGTPTNVTITDPACGLNPLSCPSVANYHPFPNGPNDQILRFFEGSQNESPVSPKFGLAYQANPDDLYYVTVAKGYRAGGLNQPVPKLTCTQDLAILGISETPLTYESDSVWSYEGGAKLRMFGGRAQVNSSVYYIDWKNPQLQNRLRCGQNYIVNAGHAVSKGFDVEAQARLGGLTLSGSVAYTNAKYTEEYSTPTPAGRTIIVNKGDELGAPHWQFSLAASYNFTIAGRYDAYLRADYQYSGHYKRGVGPGASGYDAPTYNGQTTEFVTARAGVNIKRVEVSAFVNNVTNSKDRIYQAHGAASALITSSTFRPREIGLQLAYRY